MNKNVLGKDAISELLLMLLDGVVILKGIVTLRQNGDWIEQAEELIAHTEKKLALHGTCSELSLNMQIRFLEIIFSDIERLLAHADDSKYYNHSETMLRGLISGLALAYSDKDCPDFLTLLTELQEWLWSSSNTPSTTQDEIIAKRKQRLTEMQTRVYAVLQPLYTKSYHQIAQQYRDAEKYANKGGVIILHKNIAQGWVNALRDPQHWAPGCIAVEENGVCYLACGGNDYDGAEYWELLDKL